MIIEVCISWIQQDISGLVIYKYKPFQEFTVGIDILICQMFTTQTAFLLSDKMFDGKISYDTVRLLMISVHENWAGVSAYEFRSD